MKFWSHGRLCQSTKSSVLTTVIDAVDSTNNYSVCYFLSSDKDLYCQLLPWIHYIQCCSRSHGLQSNKLLRQCHQLLSGLLANGHLPRVLRLSTNDKDDNEMIQQLIKAYTVNYCCEHATFNQVKTYTVN